MRRREHSSKTHPHSALSHRQLKISWGDDRLLQTNVMFASLFRRAYFQL